MKKFLFCCAILCFALSLKAQYGSEFFLRTRVNYIGGGRITKPDGQRVNLGYTLKGVISPGYFAWNNLEMGVNLGYEYMTDDRGRQNTWEALPFVRYYAGESDFRFFLQLESGWGWGESRMKEGHDGSHRLWVSSLRPGIWGRIKDYMAIELTLMSLEYKQVDMKDKENGTQSRKKDWQFQWLDIGFGVNFIIQF